jgi:hypothetical protein
MSDMKTSEAREAKLILTGLLASLVVGGVGLIVYLAMG